MKKLLLSALFLASCATHAGFTVPAFKVPAAVKQTAVRFGLIKAQAQEHQAIEAAAKAAENVTEEVAAANIGLIGRTRKAAICAQESLSSAKKAVVAKARAGYNAVTIANIKHALNPATIRAQLLAAKNAATVENFKAAVTSRRNQVIALVTVGAIAAYKKYYSNNDKKPACKKPAIIIVEERI